MANDGPVEHRDPDVYVDSKPTQERGSDKAQSGALDLLEREVKALRRIIEPPREMILESRVDALEWDRDMWKYTAYAFAGLFFLIVFLGVRRS